MPLTPDSSDAFIPARSTALLVFTRSVQAELSERGWPRRFARLLDGAAEAWAGELGLDAHFFIEGAGQAEVAGRKGSNVHPQIGRDFGERLRQAVGTLSARGYERIIIVGGDCPELQAADLARADRLLGSGDLVLGPDHRGGIYLIGLHSADRHLLDGIVWRKNTDFQQLQSLYRGRRVDLLPAKIDLDEWSDLRLFASREGKLHRWLERELDWLTNFFSRPGTHWVDFARQAERSRRMTSPPVSTHACIG